MEFDDTATQKKESPEVGYSGEERRSQRKRLDFGGRLRW